MIICNEDKKDCYFRRELSSLSGYGNHVPICLFNEEDVPIYSGWYECEGYISHDEADRIIRDKVAAWDGKEGE